MPITPMIFAAIDEAFFTPPACRFFFFAFRYFATATLFSPPCSLISLLPPP